MSALALVAKAWGVEVGGSDRSRSSYVELLEAAGIEVAIGHSAEQVPEDAELVASSAIAADNPELVHARAREQNVTSRGQHIAEPDDAPQSCVVDGPHGREAHV